MRLSTSVIPLPCASWPVCRRSDSAEVRRLYILALRELGITLPDEETAGRCLLVGLAFGLANGELSPEDVGNGLSMTVAARTREETRLLSVAADYSEWLGADELPRWEKELRAAAHSLAAVTDLGPSIGVPGRGPTD